MLISPLFTDVDREYLQLERQREAEMERLKRSVEGTRDDSITLSFSKFVKLLEARLRGRAEVQPGRNVRYQGT